jgi:hypothetical protein
LLRSLFGRTSARGSAPPTKPLAPVALVVVLIHYRLRMQDEDGHYPLRESA